MLQRLKNDTHAIMYAEATVDSPVVHALLDTLHKVFMPQSTITGGEHHVFGLSVRQLSVT